MFRLPQPGALAALAFAALGAIGSATAQTATQNPQTTMSPTTPTPTTAPPSPLTAAKTTLPRAERRFIEDIAVGGMAEIEMGKLAEQRAANPQVKQFASRMVQDHGKTSDELKTIASSKGVTVPAALPRSHQRDMDKLTKLTGVDFDREYMKHMVGDHKKNVSKFERMAKGARDPELKAFAARTLPTLQDHLRTAQTTHDAVKKAS